MDTLDYLRSLTAEYGIRFDVFESRGPSTARKAATPKPQRPTCGARCRDGHPCTARAVWDRDHDQPRNGRCRMHGGLSTGARSPEGKARALANLRQFRGRERAVQSASA